MTVVDGQEVGYSSLVEEGRVHSAVFTDESIFEAELERIFYTYWVYLAHESEVPEPGDYCTKSIGRHSVVVARGTDGVVRAFFNRCRHRGTTVCRYERGNAEFFRCPYHGWTYSNRGTLIGVPFPSRYGPEFDKQNLGLVEVARLDHYRGFYFASLAGDGPSLVEHLGRTAEYIDMFLQASPMEQVELRAGAAKSNFHGNWKFVGMDGYHVNFTHKTVQDLQTRRTGNAESRKNNSDRAPNLTVDLGGGHCRLDLSLTDRVEIGKATSSLIGEIPDTEAGHRYLALMVELGSRGVRADPRLARRARACVAEPATHRQRGPRDQTDLQRVHRGLRLSRHAGRRARRDQRAAAARLRMVQRRGRLRHAGRPGDLRAQPGRAAVRQGTVAGAVPRPDPGRGAR